MNDDQMIGYATALSSLMFVLTPEGGVMEAILDPERHFDGTQDAICLAQQLIAEATGLVGVGDV